MMKPRKPTFWGKVWLFGLVVVAMRLYSRRVVDRVAGHEGLEDPEVSRGFDQVARMPQMALLRRYLARRAAAMQPAGEAVDLGCGPGYLVMELARQSPRLHVTGVDLSAEMLHIAEQDARYNGLADRVAYRLGDVQRMPFEDRSLDLVVSTLSLHHWGEPRAVLSEISRVLRPGGAFLIFDLRRDMALPFYLLIWFATQFVVPGVIHRMNEPMASRNAAYTVAEAQDLAAHSSLRGWRVTGGPLWLMIEGRTPREA